MLVYRASDLLKAQGKPLDRGKLHVEKRDVHLSSGKVIQASRWVAPEETAKLTPPKAPEMEPILSQKQPAMTGQESRGEGYQPKLPGMPSSKLRIEDVPPEKRFDTVWLMRAQELIDFSPDADSIVDRLVALQKDLFMDQAGKFILPEDMIFESASKEIEFMLERAAEGQDIGAEWYTSNQDKARSILTVMDPTLGDDNNWDFLCLIMSVTSSKHNPNRNLRVAMQWYDHFKSRGVVPPLEPTTGKAWGLAGKSIAKKAEQINSLLKDHNGNVASLMQWLREPTTVGEVRKEAAKHGIMTPEVLGKKDEKLDMRARMFGHKFSAFYENLSGGVARATIDTWAIRSYQRWRNAIEPFLNSTGKIEVNVKVPLSDKYEIEKLFVKLGEKFGLMPKQVQAVMWYYEKRLYDVLHTAGRTTKAGKRMGKRRGGGSTQASFMEAAKEIFDERTAGINPYSTKGRSGRGRAQAHGSGEVPYLPGVAQGPEGSVGGPRQGGGGEATSKAQEGRVWSASALLKGLLGGSRPSHLYISREGVPGDYRYTYPWPGQRSRIRQMTAGLGGMTTPMGDADHHHRGTRRPVYHRNVKRSGDAVVSDVAESMRFVTTADMEAASAKEHAVTVRKVEEALERISASKAAMFRSPKRSYYYILHPSTRHVGQWQVSVFNEKDEPTGHFDFESKEHACYSIFGSAQASIGDSTFEMVQASKALMIVRLLKARRHVMTVRKRENRSNGTEGNWRIQGWIDFQGLKVSIENQLGTYREGKDDEGNAWRTLMRYPYGYIQRTEGNDGDHVDCYVGGRRGSQRVFIVHQNDPFTGKYDEDKVMLGFDSARDAREAYMAQYNRPDFFGSMDEVSMDRFKEMLETCDGVKLKKSLDATHPEMKYVGGAHPHTQIYHVGRKPKPVLDNYETIKHMVSPGRAGLENVGGALKIRLANGTLAVMKYGDNEGQLHDENTANAVYAVMGIHAHKSTLMTEGGKTVLVSDWLDGYTPYNELSEEDKETCRYRLQEGFVTDALLANWDVLGYGNDNIFYDPAKQDVVRIDNGGSLRYSGMGAERGDKFKDYVAELKTMTDPERKAGKIFGGIPQDEIKRQISVIMSKRDSILRVIDDPALKAKIAKRIDSLSHTLEKALHPEKRIVHRKSGKTFQQTYHIAEKKAKLVVGKLGQIYDTLPRSPIREEVKRRKIVETTVGNPVIRAKDLKAHFKKLRGMGVRPLDVVIAENAVGASGIGPKAIRDSWPKMTSEQKTEILKALAKQMGLTDTYKRLKADTYWQHATMFLMRANALMGEGKPVDAETMEVISLAMQERTARLAILQSESHKLGERLQKFMAVEKIVADLTTSAALYVPAALRSQVYWQVGQLRDKFQEYGVRGAVEGMDRVQAQLQELAEKWTVTVKQLYEQGEAKRDAPIDKAKVEKVMRKAIITCDGYSEKQGIEHLIIVGRDGKVLGEHDGNQSGVSVPDGTRYLYAHAVVHNHPNTIPTGTTITVKETGEKHTLKAEEFTLSGVDMKFANTWRVNELLAVAEKHIYRMSLNGNYYEPKVMDVALNDIAAGILIKKKTPEYMDRHPHAFARDLAKAVAKKMGWTYEVLPKDYTIEEAT